ncbi:MAG: prfA [Rickettsiales bacterium]|jgi:peptide chain release factor 1|nr:prfA [Rickettsiales bacterium]
MNFAGRLDSIVVKHKQLGDKLSSGEKIAGGDFAKLNKEYSDLSPIVEKINELRAVERAYKDSEEMMNDPSIDGEMRALAEEEFHEAKHKIEALTYDVQISLLPKDEADEKNAILEVRAGTGGDEAALFASDLFQMYQRYADRRRWKFEVLSITETGIGGYKEASATISGKDVFARLKFESGVHRVQRVPTTETQGRVHTSAATVAVLPEAEEIDVHIEEKDLRVDIFRSSGPGGQSVNTTDSAVRITHIPTGIVVSQQDEKSQHKNRAKAMKVLRARIYDKQREEADSARAAQRKGQIGSGDRSERIRTYNFPQSRVSDHRINLTLYKIDAVVREGDLDEFMDALIAEDQAMKLAAEE